MGVKEEQEFLLRVGDENFILTYQKAIEKVNQKLEIINETYSEKLGRTFISSQSSRIKTPESCLKKMIHKGYDIKEKEAQSRLNDIAGIRVICSFLDDIYRLANLLKEEEDIEIIKIKDYVKKPKASGYQSLHVIALVPIEGTEKRKVEIQIRTQAMNFWAVVEHHFVYKQEDKGKAAFEKDLKECARQIYKIDKKMLLIRKRMEQNYC